MEFKQDAAQLVLEKGYSHQQAAEHLGISLSALGRWVRAERKPLSPDSVTRKVAINLADRDELVRLRKDNEQLRMEREILKKDRRLICERNPMKYGFIQEQQKTFPVTVLCRVMGVSTSAFYTWCSNPDDSHKKQLDQVLAKRVQQIFAENKCSFGSRQLADRLQK